MVNHRRIAFWLTCFALWGYAATVARAAEYHVDTASELEHALADAQGGDRILLAGGAYGQLLLSDRTYSPALIIEAADGAVRPAFTAADFRNVTGVSVRNIDIRYGATAAPLTDFAFKIAGGGDIDLAGLWVEGAADNNAQNDPKGLIARNCTGVTIRAATFTDLYTGATLFDCTDAVVEESVFTRLASDGLVGRGLQRTSLTGNLFTNFTSDLSTGVHPDAIQLWNDHASRENQGIVIARNVVLRGRGGPSQGIFLRSKNDALPSRDILIEHNVIHQSMKQGIALQNADGVTVRYNTVAPFDPKTDRPGIEARAPYANVEISQNLYVTLRAEERDLSGVNRPLDYDNPWSADYSENLLANPRAAEDATPADFQALTAAGAHDFPRAIGPFAAPLFEIAAARADDDDLSRFYFFLSGPPSLKRGDWRVEETDGEVSQYRNETAIQHEFNRAGLAEVTAEARLGRLEGAAGRIVRVHPNTLARLEFNGDLHDTAPEPAGVSGAVATISAEYITFDGAPAADGKFLTFGAGPQWSGMPKLEMSVRLRRTSPASDWQFLAVAPGVWQVKMIGDRLYASFTNAAGETTALNAPSAGLSDGAWRDLTISYDGRAGIIEARDGDRLIARVPAPPGLLAYRPTGPLLFGGAPWGNSFAADIDRFELTR